MHWIFMLHLLIEFVYIVKEDACFFFSERRTNTFISEKTFPNIICDPDSLKISLYIY